MFEIFKKRVQVTIIDDATGELMGTSKLALTDLPDSFLEDTTLDLGEKTWAVETADPPFKRLFAKSKELTLRLKPTQMMDPQEILYLLPTIANDLVPSEGQMANGSEALLSEDDWRQIEFISNRLEAEILQEISDIEAVYRRARHGIGFREIHVRRRIPDPLNGSTLGLADLEGHFGPASSALRFQGCGHRISKGFCYDLGGKWIFYGTVAADSPRILAVTSTADVRSALTSHSSESLNSLCREHGLYLVDWCRCIKARSESVEFAAIFSPFQE